MNNSDIDLIRKKYNSLNLEKKRMREVRNKILELEQDPKVKEYLKLLEIIENISEENCEKQFDESVSKIVSYTNDSNHFLFDYGNISVLTLKSEDEIEYNYENSACMHVYRDLETTEYYIEMRKNEIEPMPPEWRIGHCTVEYVNRKKYNELRNYFIEQIINRPQEEVGEELLRNNKQLVKGK